MHRPNHDRLTDANRELRDLLLRAIRLANEDGRATEPELMAVAAHLLPLAPEIGDASRGETLDADSRDEIAEFVRTFRALQQAVEKVRGVIRAGASANPSSQRTKQYTYKLCYFR